MTSYTSHSIPETKKIAEEWLEKITASYGNSDEALVVGLSGHLGAGKTAFVKIVGSILGVIEEITSPTFVIMKIYETEHSQWKRLVHIDAYRLERREELEALNWEALVADPHNFIMIEWPENVGLKEFAPMSKLSFVARQTEYSIEII